MDNPHPISVAHRPRTHGITTLQITGAGGLPHHRHLRRGHQHHRRLSGRPTPASPAYPAGIAPPPTSTNQRRQAKPEPTAPSSPRPGRQDQLLQRRRHHPTRHRRSGLLHRKRHGRRLLLRRPGASRVLDTRGLSGSWWNTAGATNSFGVTVDGPGASPTAQYAPSTIGVAPTAVVWLTVTAVNPGEGRVRDRLPEQDKLTQGRATSIRRPDAPLRMLPRSGSAPTAR